MITTVCDMPDIAFAFCFGICLPTGGCMYDTNDLLGLISGKPISPGFQPAAAHFLQPAWRLGPLHARGRRPWPPSPAPAPPARAAARPGPSWRMPLPTRAPLRPWPARLPGFLPVQPSLNCQHQSVIILGQNIMSACVHECPLLMF